MIAKKRGTPGKSCSIMDRSRMAKGPATRVGGPSWKACASVSRVLFSAPTRRGVCPPFVWSRCRQRDRSTYPPGPGEPPFNPPCGGCSWPIWSFSPRGLPCRAACAERGGLLHHRFTLAPTSRGGLFSVALSVTSPSPVMPLPVRKRGALRCPDFPPLPTDREQRRSDAQDIKERSAANDGGW